MLVVSCVQLAYTFNVTRASDPATVELASLAVGGVGPLEPPFMPAVRFYQVQVLTSPTHLPNTEEEVN